jgi:hypothetical protein
MQTEQGLIDREMILGRSRYVRSVVEQTCEKADLIRWQAERECQYSWLLLQCAAQFVDLANGPPGGIGIPPYIKK